MTLRTKKCSGHGRPGHGASYVPGEMGKSEIEEVVKMKKEQDRAVLQLRCINAIRHHTADVTSVVLIFDM